MRKITVRAETYQEFIDRLLDIVFDEYEQDLNKPYEEEDDSEELTVFIWKKKKHVI